METKMMTSPEEEGEVVTEDKKVKKVAAVINKLLQSDLNDNVEILSKSKTKRDREEEIEEQEGTAKRAENKQKKRAWRNIGKSYPDIVLDNEKERKLRIIGTQGVVQLFSTIEKYKRQVEDTLRDTRTEHMKAKALEDAGEDAFLKILDKEGSKVNVATPLIKKEVKSEVTKSVKSDWNVLAKNFYDDTSLSNWDQNDSDEG